MKDVNAVSQMITKLRGDDVIWCILLGQNIIS